MKWPISTQCIASSEAIFGSSSRGDADANSDRDILIVDDNIDVLRTRSTVLAEEGWSVAPYTFAKLKALADKGALFIQHLKLESSIIADLDGRLDSFLSSFHPRSDYGAEIQENSHLASIAEIMPKVERGPLLAADILYVAVRNFGVLTLAERNIHLYSFSSIISKLEELGITKKGSARTLASLRFLKCLYRSGEIPVGRRAELEVAKALSCLPDAYFPTSSTFVDPRDILVAPKPSSSYSAYYQLRDLERRYLALTSLGLANKDDEMIVKLSRWITNPRAYVNISSRLAPSLRRSMREKIECLPFMSSKAFANRSVI